MNLSFDWSGRYYPRSFLRLLLVSLAAVALPFVLAFANFVVLVEKIFDQSQSAVTQAAAEELSDWAEELSESELRALRDPRNWVRPVVAVGAGSLATGALVLIELRRRGKQQGEGGLRALGSGLRSRL